MSESNLVRVIHKVRAFIGGRTYDPGEEALISENDFHESVHTRVDEPAAVEAADPATDATP